MTGDLHDDGTAGTELVHNQFVLYDGAGTPVMNSVCGALQCKAETGRTI